MVQANNDKSKSYYSGGSKEPPFFGADTPALKWC